MLIILNFILFLYSGELEKNAAAQPSAKIVLEIILSIVGSVWRCRLQSSNDINSMLDVFPSDQFRTSVTQFVAFTEAAHPINPILVFLILVFNPKEFIK